MKSKQTRRRKRRGKKMKFSRKDYKSGDGMLTSVWGPSAWHFLHTMSFNYPIEPTTKQKKQYQSFILSLTDVLPCKYCRINLKKNLKTHPLTMKDMESRASFSLWVYKLHERVNTMLKKKSNVSYEEIRDRYEHFRARCNNTSKKSRRKFRENKKSKHHNKTKSRKHKQCKKCTKKEKGCTIPYYGKRSKCVLKIVPKKSKMRHTFSYA